jgi:hypothetical protein
MYSPRPHYRIRHIELPGYEAKGIYVAQRKFDGTRTLVHITPNLQVEVWRPGRTPHLQWSMSQAIIDQVLSLNIQAGLEYWLDGELLNGKTSDANYKNRIVFFDVLQAGRYLFGRPNLMGRQDILHDICRNPTQRESGHGIALRVTENLWLAETFTSNFSERWEEFIHLDEIEGLVLKKKNSVLDNFGSRKYEADWQLRCRRKEKGYDF